MQTTSDRRARTRLRAGTAISVSLILSFLAVGAVGVNSAQAATATTSNVKLSGTTWLIYWHWKNDQKKGPCTETFKNNGTFTDCDGYNGTWAKTGSKLTLKYSSCSETWTGTYHRSDKKFGGTMSSSSCDESGIFYMERETDGIAAVSYSGSATGNGSPPTVTVTGTSLGSEPNGVTASCGDTGEDFPGGNFYMDDDFGDWNAGAPGNCMGLVVQTFTRTEVAFSFGDYYDTAPYHHVLNAGDRLTIDVNGTMAIAYVTYPGAGTDPSEGPSYGSGPVSG